MNDDAEQFDISQVDPAVQALLPTYIRRRKTDVVTISTLLAEENFTEIGRLAHNMRGSGSAYGLPKITDIGAGMEQAAKAQDVNTIIELNKVLENFVAQLPM